MGSSTGCSHMRCAGGRSACGAGLSAASPTCRRTCGASSEGSTASCDAPDSRRSTGAERAIASGSCKNVECDAASRIEGRSAGTSADNADGSLGKDPQTFSDCAKVLSDDAARGAFFKRIACEVFSISTA